MLRLGLLLALLSLRPPAASALQQRLLPGLVTQVSSSLLNFSRNYFATAPDLSVPSPSLVVQGAAQQELLTLISFLSAYSFAIDQAVLYQLYFLPPYTRKFRGLLLSLKSNHELPTKCAIPGVQGAFQLLFVDSIYLII